MFNQTFKALVNEAQFTKDILGAGATQIRQGNYAQKGQYFQAFTSLSTGLERIGKLCLMLDYYIDNNGQFPDFKYLKNQMGHDLELLYNKSQEISLKKQIQFRWLKSFDDPIHSNILKILSSFAKSDRYSNINMLTNSKQQNDPVSSWFDGVDLELFESRVSNKKKNKIANNARLMEKLAGGFTSVSHTAETGEQISSVEDASLRTGIYEAVLPYRQLYILQMIRYWVELIWELQYKAMAVQQAEDIPFFSEIFAPFFNEDSYFRTRKTWDKL